MSKPVDVLRGLIEEHYAAELYGVHPDTVATIAKRKRVRLVIQDGARMYPWRALARALDDDHGHKITRHTP
ncbi:hypothetical protein KUS72_005235 [Escherichia coli]|nr:hypothetical protein [Escherichia coli]